MQGMKRLAVGAAAAVLVLVGVYAGPVGVQAARSDTQAQGGAGHVRLALQASRYDGGALLEQGRLRDVGVYSTSHITTIYTSCRDEGYPKNCSDLSTINPTPLPLRR